jgi:glucose-1-phosphate adenylyltransferase
MANSGIRSVYVLTQYKSQSLAEHVQRAWGNRGGFDSFVTVVPAQMRMGESWYRGTADSVFQNIHLIEEYRADAVLVFGADHVYKMNVRQMTDYHFEHSAVATIACLPIPVSAAHEFGIVQVDDQQRVIGFQEKPERDPITIPGDPNHCLASMGNYVFAPGPLVEELRADAERESHHDFGRNILPTLVKTGKVFAYNFSHNRIRGVSDELENAYWRDVGTIDAYWEANIALTHVVPELNLYARDWPIWTYQEQLPPAKFVFDDHDRRGTAIDSIVAGGCIVSGSIVRRSLLSSSVRVHDFCTVEDSVLLPGAGRICRRVRSRRGSAPFPRHEERDHSRDSRDARPAGPSPALNAETVRRADGVCHRSSTPTCTFRRQLGRSRSVPGRLRAVVSSARSSAWTSTSADAVAPA